jgi:AcrR family transcriptional regulator
MARPVDPNLRIELLAAAEAEFVQHGLEATRIDDIVVRAGRSKGAFYQYFESKDHIFRDLVENLLARLSLIVERPVVTDEKAPADRADFLDRWLQRDIAIFEFILANRDMVRILLCGGYSVAFAGLMDAFAKRTYDVILESLSWGKHHGVYRRDFHTHFVAVMIAGAYDRLARELVDTVDKAPNIRFMCVQAQEFVLKGINDS